jgi:hypothetical protein
MYKTNAIDARAATTLCFTIIIDGTFMDKSAAFIDVKPATKTNILLFFTPNWIRIKIVKKDVKITVSPNIR